jgi:hypothetical protein
LMDEDEIALEVREEVRALPMVTREMMIRAESFDEGANTVEVVFTTGARGARFDWNRWAMIDEELATEAGNVRLDRLNGGAPVLNTHNSYELDAQIGVVVDGSARMTGGQGIATLRLSRREDLAPIVADIRDGIIRNISVGYVVHTYEITETEGQRALYRAVDWEPYEISFVPMPFDAGAQTRSLEPAQGGHPCIIRRAIPATQETIMDEDEIVVVPGTVPAPTPRAADPAPAPAPAPAAPEMASLASIRTAVRNAGLTDEAAFEIAATHEATPLTRDALMAEIGRRFAERDTPAPSTSRAPAQVSNGVTLNRAISEAIYARFNPSAVIPDDAQQFRYRTLTELGARLLEAQGVDARNFSPMEIAQRSMMSTSDFPTLVTGPLSRRLRDSYDENPQSYQMWARRAPNVRDFKPVEIVQVSASPDFEKLEEGAEITYGTATAGKVTYQAATYAKAMTFTFQMMINDDLRGLDRIVTSYGASSARLENRLLYKQITDNPQFDGQTLFHSSRGNLAGAGAVISDTTLSAGRTAMRLQKGLQKEELNLTPRYLLVPAAQEQLALKWTSEQIVATKALETNTFRRGGPTALEPVVEALLDGNSSTAYYMMAGNGSIDTMEYAYLDGFEGVQMDNRAEFDRLGMSVRGVLHFAYGLIDWRGFYKNPGA